MKKTIDPDQMHRDFSRLQVLADCFSTQFEDLVAEVDLGRFLWSGRGVST